MARFVPISRAIVRVVRNPTLKGLRRFVLEGERSTWPQIAQIRAAARIRDLLSATLNRLSAVPSASAAK